MGNNKKILMVNNTPLLFNNKFLYCSNYFVDALPPTNVLNTSFTANWDLLSGATDYILEISTHSDFSILIGSINTGNVNTYNVTNLSELTTYYYRLTAILNSVILPTYSQTISVTTQQGYDMDVLLVSGGGDTDGSYSAPGGGGGGSVKLFTAQRIAIGNPIIITVGAGGYNTPSTFYNLTSITKGNGYDYGYDRINQNGIGGGYSFAGPIVNTPGITWGQNFLGHIGGGGYSLGTGTGPYDYNGYGGGGAGDDGDGKDATSSRYGDGGAGRTINIDGVNKIYGRGGNGTANRNAGSNGAANTGNGASGCGTYSEVGWSGRNGGSGIVRVKYLTNSVPTLIGGTKTTSGIYTIHTFTTSGVLTLS